MGIVYDECVVFVGAFVLCLGGVCVCVYSVYMVRLCGSVEV